MRNKIAVVLIGENGKLGRPYQNLFLLSEDIHYTVSDTKPELVKSMPEIDLASEFADMLKKQKERNKERYGHLRYEKKLTFPLRLTRSYIGRFFIMSPILSFIELGYNENFPKNNRAKKRDIIKRVYAECLFSAYTDCYKSHFYKRANPNDPLWGEKERLGRGQG
ncbi:hypothetical protein [Bacillus sp. MUM 13]|uniref:hypothetical protein n=1 Tax=Bacillus sp. MUM 13 TaxID=1678001 RepID=UPI0008F57644|nr:hypothetical protein [Bacillus sp. MUM 13]OIK13776.1 hypothetical protein BIV59_04775 [Bacillus sp. MUM 13]